MPVAGSLDAATAPRSIYESARAVRPRAAHSANVSRSPHTGQQTIGSPAGLGRNMRGERCIARTRELCHQPSCRSPSEETLSYEGIHWACSRAQSGILRRYMNGDGFISRKMRDRGFGPPAGLSSPWVAPPIGQMHCVEAAFAASAIGPPSAARRPPPRASSPGRRSPPASGTSRNRFRRSRSGRRRGRRAARARCR